MKHLFWSLILVAGCTCVSPEYIERDRKNYETLAPRIIKMLEATDIYTPKQEADIRDRLEAWDVRTSTALRSEDE